MSDRFEALRAFVRVARTGSFSSTAKEFGVSQPVVSRAISRLERDLKCPLFVRTTRTVVLTEAGAEYLTRIEPILAALDEAAQALRGIQATRGTLRIALPVGIAIREIVPNLAAFLDRHPLLRVELQLKDEWRDLLKDGVDVAIRLGELKDSAATSRVVGVNQRIVVASPAYLAEAGTPESPEDLKGHRIVIGPPGTNADAWTFHRDGKTISVQLQSQLKANVNEAATAAAVAGMGVLSSGLWGCREELNNGKLVRLLPGWTMESIQAHAVFPAGRATKLAARLFVDYVSDILKRQ
jgi:DNA-binding transcriptional LysR family regulator